MSVVMDLNLMKQLELIEKKPSWPVARLAGLLGRPRRYVYRKIDSGSFDVINDGGYIKVISESVVRYYTEDHHRKV